MPSLLKKYTILGISLLIATLAYFYYPSNSKDEEIIGHPQQATNITPTHPNSPVTTNNLITNNEKPHEIKDETRISQISIETQPISELDTHDKTNSDSNEEISVLEPNYMEEPNPHWAFEKENYYINLFSEEESLAGFVLSEAQCEGIQCKLSFLLNDENQRDDITNKLVERLMSESQELSVAFDLNTPSGIAVLYISDKK